MSLISLNACRPNNQTSAKKLDGWAKAALAVDAIVGTVLLAGAALVVAHAHGIALPAFLHKVTLLTALSPSVAYAIGGAAALMLVVDTGLAIKLACYYNQPASQPTIGGAAAADPNGGAAPATAVAPAPAGGAEPPAAAGSGGSAPSTAVNPGATAAAAALAAGLGGSLPSAPATAATPALIAAKKPPPLTPDEVAKITSVLPDRIRVSRNLDEVAKITPALPRRKSDSINLLEQFIEDPEGLITKMKASEASDVMDSLCDPEGEVDYLVSLAAKGLGETHPLVVHLIKWHTYVTQGDPATKGTRIAEATAAGIALQEQLFPPDKDASARAAAGQAARGAQEARIASSNAAKATETAANATAVALKYSCDLVNYYSIANLNEFHVTGPKLGFFNTTLRGKEGIHDNEPATTLQNLNALIAEVKGGNHSRLELLKECLDAIFKDRRAVPAECFASD